jgi:tetratricopeptide (TPR) repeat protein
MAVKDLSKAIKGLPGDMRPVGVLCRCLFEYSFLADEPLRDREKIEEYIQNWLKREPENADALGLYVDSLRRKGQPQTALSVAQKGLRVDPNNPDFPFQLGVIYAGIREYVTAVEWLNKAEETYLLHKKNIYPRALGYGDILGHRAKRYLILGDEESARRDIHSAYSYGELDERTFWDWLQPMETCQALGDEELREKFCELWITHMPECGSAYFHRAALRLEQGRCEEAVSDMAKARQYGFFQRWDVMGRTRERICSLLEVRRDVGYALAVAQVGVGMEQEGRIWGVGHSQQQEGRKALLLEAYSQLTQDNNVSKERIFEIRQSIAECYAELGETEEVRKWRSLDSED